MRNAPIPDALLTEWIDLVRRQPPNLVMDLRVLEPCLPGSQGQGLPLRLLVVRAQDGVLRAVRP